MKKYWLRGLTIGILFYLVSIAIGFMFVMFLVDTSQAGDAFVVALYSIAVYLLPVIPLSLLIGFLFGIIPNKSFLLWVPIFVVLIAVYGGFEYWMVKTTFFPKPVDPKVQLDKLLEGKRQVPCLGSNPPGAVCYE